MECKEEFARLKRLQTTAVLQVMKQRNRKMRCVFDADNQQAVVNSIALFDQLFDEYVRFHEELCEWADEAQLTHEVAVYRRHETDAMEFRAKCRSWIRANATTQPAALPLPAAHDQVASTSLPAATSLPTASLSPGADAQAGNSSGSHGLSKFGRLTCDWSAHTINSAARCASTPWFPLGRLELFCY